ncbi:ADP-ribosylation factor-like protein 2-binding protein [Sitophilus oryzae]|uniref:ADP-ribosylation factor-like protein 2-binding protein n=1 Tax=Sitophilus oryzae TaxID=7048 RepID=A0A6J2XBE6_SITOR|nr:ADP-ribosylation factor-like protein 2-binding protein [Sitophilus oryzae]
MAATKCEMTKSVDQNEHEISFFSVDTEGPEKSFADIVGCIENIIISDKFMRVQNTFLETYYREFVRDDENKLIYTDIFKKYLETVERFIEQELVKEIPGFEMQILENLLKNKSKKELDGEIFEMLSTFWNFSTFKEMILDYKNMKEGKGIDFSKDILVTKYDLDGI